MKRAMILVGALAFASGLAFLVARPAADAPATTPYVGARGASRSRASGLGISLRRGDEVRPLAPGTPVRAGDVLHFVVRAERARHLIVRLRDGAAPVATIFPTSGTRQSAPAQPGEVLPAVPALSRALGKVIVTAIFADRPSSLDDARAHDTEEIDLVMEKE